MHKKTYAIRYVPGQPEKIIMPPASFISTDQILPVAATLSTRGVVRVLVWNIFKQQRAEWQSILTGFGKDTDLMLLQEAQTTPEMVKFATTYYRAADQVPALYLPQSPSGVMTMALVNPVYCYPFREREPILRLAKSALITVYPLPDRRLLMVVNIHAINFSLGVNVYSKQLLSVGQQITRHSTR